MSERSPAESIERHRALLAPLSDDDFMAQLIAFEPLPQLDDDDPIWDDDSTWDRVSLLIAFADAVGDRRLIDAIGPVFQRAALGDAYDMMQGIRHGIEQAIGPNWQILVQIMLPLTHHDRAGCRRWAVRELGLLRDVETIPQVLAALSDHEPRVRQEACMSLSMIAHDADVDTRTAVRTRLLAVADDDHSNTVRDQARWAAKRLES